MEKRIQNEIYKNLFDRKEDGRNKFFWITPNVKLFDHESDLLFKDANDYLYEFEIKTNRSDFLNDFRNKKQKHELLESRSGYIPNYFYFAAPEAEVGVNDIPDYAGLYLYRDIKGRLEINVFKAAPLLHEGKFGIETNLKLAASIYFKYWRCRAGISTKLR